MEIDISCNYTQLSINVKYLSKSFIFFSEIIVTFTLPTTEAPLSANARAYSRPSPVKIKFITLLHTCIAMHLKTFYHNHKNFQSHVISYLIQHKSASTENLGNDCKCFISSDHNNFKP